MHALTHTPKSMKGNFFNNLHLKEAKNEEQLMNMKCLMELYNEPQRTFSTFSLLPIIIIVILR